MDWQTPEDTVPSAFITDANVRSLLGKPPATGAWREGDPVGHRQFVTVTDLALEFSRRLPSARIAYETHGALNDDASNAILVAHALTGDSHIVGNPGNGHATAGWWNDLVGPGKAIDTDRWFVVSPNILGGCQGSTGPASHAPDGAEFGARFPFITIRDQVAAQVALSDALGIDKWAAVIGGSMGGMHALEWAVAHPDRLDKVAILAAPPVSTADQIAHNSVQVESLRTDPAFADGAYYDAADGDGPHRGLALARRLALLNYRSSDELNERFARTWQSDVSPWGKGGRYAIESYLDFHGNKFARRFDANSYVTLVEAMSSHDIARGRGTVAQALARATMPALVLGIDSDRLFPVSGQEIIAEHLPGNIDGALPHVIHSPFGHDGFLIEDALVSAQLKRLLAL
ncbi:homoserine O-acetyltransferase [Salinibacterium sp. NG22]|uniref:homoserine O-acetyltransferase MetX n=1 Tax=Salinibacterium sp. NG22 TaxID=2792040 RepID=UPI0018CE4FEA|nr:homoserine O-acetyltransferase [Salinibacterium sp. NG22]MBH0111288.1 homoserine O-acetyltransferase [Salinibacterium sp. NG22]